MENVWKARSSPQVLTEDIDGLLACFSAATGQTHLLDAFPAEVFCLLAESPRTAIELKHDLSECLEQDEALLDKVDDVLAELCRLQLVDVSTA